MVMSRDGRKNERRSRSVLRVRGRRFRAAAGRSGRVAGTMPPTFRCCRLGGLGAFWRVESPSVASEFFFVCGKQSGIYALFIFYLADVSSDFLTNWMLCEKGMAGSQQDL